MKKETSEQGSGRSAWLLIAGYTLIAGMMVAGLGLLFHLTEEPLQDLIRATSRRLGAITGESLWAEALIGGGWVLAWALLSYTGFKLQGRLARAGTAIGFTGTGVVLTTLFALFAGANRNGRGTYLAEQNPGLLLGYVLAVVTCGAAAYLKEKVSPSEPWTPPAPDARSRALVDVRQNGQWDVAAQHHWAPPHWWPAHESDEYHDYVTAHRIRPAEEALRKQVVAAHREGAPMPPTPERRKKRKR